MGGAVRVSPQEVLEIGLSLYFVMKKNVNHFASEDFNILWASLGNSM